MHGLSIWGPSPFTLLNSMGLNLEGFFSGKFLILVKLFENVARPHPFNRGAGLLILLLPPFPVSPRRAHTLTHPTDSYKSTETRSWERGTQDQGPPARVLSLLPTPARLPFQCSCVTRSSAQTPTLVFRHPESWAPLVGKQ